MGNSSPRLLVIFTAATALVAGLVIVLATDNWIFLPIVLGAHAIATVLVVIAIGKRVDEGAEPDDPIVKERLDEEEATTR